MQINKQDFTKEVLESDKLTIVKFTRDPNRCGNCASMIPVFEEFEKENPQVKIVSMDADAPENKEIITKYKPEGKWDLPLVCYFSGGNLMAQLTGRVLKEDLLLPLMSTIELESLAYKGIRSVGYLKKKLQEESQTLNVIESVIQFRSFGADAPVIEDMLPEKETAEPKKRTTPVLPGDPAEENQLDCCQ